MLGYVTCEKAELKVKEYELYSSYYCGVCKSIGSRYSQLARMVLSYDSVFLAMILDGMDGTAPDVTEGSCMLHPVKGKNIAESRGIEYSADVMLILAWFNYLDDLNDADTGERPAGESAAPGLAKSTAMKVAGRSLKKAYSGLSGKYPELCESITSRIDELSRLEKEKCRSLDEAAEAFAQIMLSIFDGGLKFMAVYDEGPARAAKDLGYHLGKWIYLMDAWEDLEKDISTGAYNPLIYRYGYTDDPAAFREEIREKVEFNLMMYLSAMGRMVTALELKGNKGIIENVVFMGLLRRTEEALGLNGEEQAGRQSADHAEDDCGISEETAGCEDDDQSEN